MPDVLPGSYPDDHLVDLSAEVWSKQDAERALLDIIGRPAKQPLSVLAEVGDSGFAITRDHGIISELDDRTEKRSRRGEPMEMASPDVASIPRVTHGFSDCVDLVP
jgi:hypothetical protein